MLLYASSGQLLRRLGITKIAQFNFRFGRTVARGPRPKIPARYLRDASRSNVLTQCPHTSIHLAKGRSAKHLDLGMEPTR